MDSQRIFKDFPGYSRIYRLSDPASSRALRGEIDMDYQEVMSILKGEMVPGTSVPVRWAMGASTPGDVIWTTLALPVLVSERIVALLREGGFSGWEVVPVELRGKAGELFPGYYFISIRGRCGAIDYGRSEKIEKVYPSGVFPALRGIYFDPSGWDGSDVFVPEDSGFKLVVERVVLSLRRGKVKNVLFEPLDKIEVDVAE